MRILFGHQSCFFEAVRLAGEHAQQRDLHHCNVSQIFSSKTRELFYKLVASSGRRSSNEIACFRADNVMGAS